MLPYRYRPSAAKTSTSTSSKKRSAGVDFVAPRLRKLRSGSSSLDLPLATIEKTPGKVYAFGTGDCAQLGLGESVLLRKKPANLTVLNDKNIVDIAAGRADTYGCR